MHVRILTDCCHPRDATGIVSISCQTSSLLSVAAKALVYNLFCAKALITTVHIRRKQARNATYERKVGAMGPLCLCAYGRVEPTRFDKWKSLFPLSGLGLVCNTMSPFMFTILVEQSDRL
jgi:hypothetical protein